MNGKMNLSLNEKYSVPMIAFGTYNRNLSLVSGLVGKAIELGYRHFDTGVLYKNEQQVGQAIRDHILQIEREKLFITSKLPMNGMANDKVEYFLEKSLNNLKTDYLDLYLIHAPFAIKYISDEQFYPVDQNTGLLIADNEVDFVETWKCLEKAYRQGKVRAIGVSNFNIEQLQRILDFCENRIRVSAFAPLATPKKCSPQYLIKENEIVKELATKHKRTWSQIALRFLTQQEIIVIPAADNEAQLAENLNCNTFSLSDEDMRRLSTLDTNKRIYAHDYVQGVTDHREYPFKNDDNYNVENK